MPDFMGYEVKMRTVAGAGVMAWLTQFPNFVVVMDTFEEALRELHYVFTDGLEIAVELGILVPPPKRT